MANKRFITYKCNKCLRTKDFESDKLHAFVNLCTITNKCTGRLSPVATKSLRDVLPSAPVSGLEDWSGLGGNTKPETVVKHYPIVSSTTGALTLIAKGTTLPNFLHVVFVTQQESVKEYTEFDFNMTSAFSTIQGLDSSPAAKLLSFTHSATVTVFADGVELIEGPDMYGYVLNFSGNNGYSITLNTPRTVSTYVKIVVYPAQSLQVTQALVFTKNSALSSIDTAWSNVHSVKIDADEWTVYTCHDSSTLPLNALLNIYPGNNQILDIVDANLADFALLLSYTSYQPCDRVYDKLIKLSDLASENSYLRSFYYHSVLQVQCSASAVSGLSLPLDIVTVDTVTREWSTTNVSPTFDQDPYVVNSKIIGIN